MIYVYMTSFCDLLILYEYVFRPPLSGRERRLTSSAPRRGRACRFAPASSPLRTRFRTGTSPSTTRSAAHSSAPSPTKFISSEFSTHWSTRLTIIVVLFHVVILTLFSIISNIKLDFFLKQAKFCVGNTLHAI